MGKPVPSLLMLLLGRGRVPLDYPTRWQDGWPSHSSNHVLQRTCKIMPKALAGSKNQVLAFSSFSVTLLRRNVYYILIHGIKQFSNQHLFPKHRISTCYSMQYNGSSSLISCEKQTIQIEFLSLQGKPKHTTRRGTPAPHTSTVPIDSLATDQGSPPWRTMPH
jgi:hypothetical protein